MSQNIADKRTGLEVIAVVIAAFSALTTVCGWIWFGGRLAQRVDTLEQQANVARSESNTARDVNAAQTADIAVMKSQYNEILAQLNRIYSKLDRR
jgi:hypothetical protein